MLKLGVSYFGSRIQKHVRSDMRDIRKHNCNYVVHCFSELDMQYYKGTMAEVADISRGQGLDVWVDPWAVGGVFGGESYSRFVAENLGSRQVSARGESLPAACLNNEKFREFMFSWINAASGMKPQVYFWDEPHFYLYPLVRMKNDPTLWACRCAVCRRKFKKIFGYKMRIRLNDDIKLFKEDSIVEFLKLMCDYAKSTDRRPVTPAKGGASGDRGLKMKTAKNAVCFLPFKGGLGGIMDWSKPSRIPSMDIIGTDPYWVQEPLQKDVRGLVSGFSGKIKALADRYGKEGQIWILNFLIKKGTENDIETAVKAAYSRGIRNIAAWSYLGTGCMSYLASDDPKKVWDTLGAVYSRYSRNK